MDAGFFRGTSTDQDSRFTDKEKKLLKTMRFEPIVEKKVDLSKVNLDVLKPWINSRLNDILGMEDEVVVSYVYELLEKDRFPDPKKLQIYLTGFLQAKNARLFIADLWQNLNSAQESVGGIPSAMLEKKKEEIRQRKADMDVGSALKQVMKEQAVTKVVPLAEPFIQRDFGQRDDSRNQRGWRRQRSNSRSRSRSGHVRRSRSGSRHRRRGRSRSRSRSNHRSPPRRFRESFSQIPQSLIEMMPGVQLPSSPPPTHHKAAQKKVDESKVVVATPAIWNIPVQPLQALPSLGSPERSVPARKFRERPPSSSPLARGQSPSPKRTRPGRSPSPGRRRPAKIRPPSATRSRSRSRSLVRRRRRKARSSDRKPSSRSVKRRRSNSLSSVSSIDNSDRSSSERDFVRSTVVRSSKPAPEQHNRQRDERVYNGSGRADPAPERKDTSTRPPADDRQRTLHPVQQAPSRPSKHSSRAPKSAKNEESKPRKHRSRAQRTPAVEKEVGARQRHSTDDCKAHIKHVKRGKTTHSKDKRVTRKPTRVVEEESPADTGDDVSSSSSTYCRKHRKQKRTSAASKMVKSREVEEPVSHSSSDVEKDAASLDSSISSSTSSPSSSSSSTSSDEEGSSSPSGSCPEKGGSSASGSTSSSSESASASSDSDDNQSALERRLREKALQSLQKRASQRR